MSDGTVVPVGKKRRVLLIMTPLLLTILGLVSINMLFGWQPTGAERVRRPATSAATTAGVVQSEAVAGATMGSPTAVSTAILFETAVPTPESIEPVATIPADVRIELIGPPAGSQFAMDAPISFYWRWPFDLSETQQFAVYLLRGQQEILLGILTEPNLGNAYHLSSALTTTTAQAEAVQWEARLESVPGQDILLTSERRTLFLSGRSNN